MRVFAISTIVICLSTVLTSCGEEDPLAKSNRFAQCLEKMMLVLKKDPRYIDHEATSMTEDEANELFNTYAGLSGKTLACAGKYEEVHMYAVLEACKELSCDKHYSGDCEALTIEYNKSGVSYFEQLLEKCPQ